MDKVIVIGAIDRHNYGDLLFPILTTEYLKENHKNIPIEYYGSISSDLSQFGAIKTKGCNEMIKASITDNSVVIIVGGAVLFATWINIISYLKSDMFYKFISTLNKLIPSDFMELIIMKSFHFKLKKPFIIEKKVFSPFMPKITYNAVGASGISFVTKKSAKYLANSLNNSDYLSVREQKSYVNLKEIGVTKEIIVSPDSALIMSDYFSIEILEKKAEQSTIDVINKFNRNYFCFQVGLKYAKNNYAKIASILDEISFNHSIPILLSPIGNAPGHSNDVALKRILKEMKTTNAQILKSNNVYDIMLGIAASRIFAGTSLHGNITATSFNIQAIVLTSKIPKLNNYVRTWLNEDEINIVEFEDLPTEFSKLISNNFNGYTNLQELKNKVYQNYRQLFKVSNN